MAGRIPFKTSDYITVYQRDTGRCGICGESVDPAEVEIDHIHPISRGGAHEPGNWQLAHKRCNRAKRDRMAGDPPRQPKPPKTPPPIIWPPLPVEAGPALTVPEIATRLHVSEWTVREWLRNGRLRGYLPAGRRGGWRVKEADLERYMEGTANRPDSESAPQGQANAAQAAQLAAMGLSPSPEELSGEHIIEQGPQRSATEHRRAYPPPEGTRPDGDA